MGCRRDDSDTGLRRVPPAWLQEERSDSQCREPDGQDAAGEILANTHAAIKVGTMALRL
jgi:hypothetical protein